MFGRIGVGELVLILAIALIIFGPAKLPELGKVLGEAVRNFRKSSEKMGEELMTGETPARPAATGAAPKQVGVTVAEGKEAVAGVQTEKEKA
jgi:sec-independent protein translocase protein TatA